MRDGTMKQTFIFIFFILAASCLSQFSKAGSTIQDKEREVNEKVDQIRNKVAEIVQKINALEETIKNAKFPKDESYYRGEKKYGLKDGIGSMRTPKGDYYVGQWKRGLV